MRDCSALLSEPILSPSQRIIATKHSYPTYLVFTTAELLDAAKNSEGETVRWEDWLDWFPIL